MKWEFFRLVFFFFLARCHWKSFVISHSFHLLFFFFMWTISRFDAFDNNTIWFIHVIISKVSIFFLDQNKSTVVRTVWVLSAGRRIIYRTNNNIDRTKLKILLNYIIVDIVSIFRMIGTKKEEIASFRLNESLWYWIFIVFLLLLLLLYFLFHSFSLHFSYWWIGMSPFDVLDTSRTLWWDEYFLIFCFLFGWKK